MVAGAGACKRDRNGRPGELRPLHGRWSLHDRRIRPRGPWSQEWEAIGERPPPRQQLALDPPVEQDACQAAPILVGFQPGLGDGTEQLLHPGDVGNHVRWLVSGVEHSETASGVPKSKKTEPIAEGDRYGRINMQVLMLTEDSDGISHFSERNIQMSEQQFAPPAPSMLVSDGETASNLLFLVLPAGWSGELHRSPCRQVAFVLRGQFRVEAGDGEIREMGPGEIFRMEDVSGSGHKSAAIGPDNLELAIVQY